KDYLNPAKRQPPTGKALSENDLIFEFMLNALRLTQGVPKELFYQRTGITLQQIEPLLTLAKQRKLLEEDAYHLAASSLGKKFLNDLITLFLLEEKIA
ncbi:MAG: YggW family oxidoreductase, partial [Gammaproteobacteria bacterium]|nr:YggW family oxidoreductase [Gammaproteobacteria bacterium]